MMALIFLLLLIAMLSAFLGKKAVATPSLLPR